MGQSFLRRYAGLLFVGVAAATWMLWLTVRDRPQAETSNLEVPRVRAELIACLLGEPVDEAWAIQERLRRIQLAIEKGSDIDWPSRCAEHAQRLEELLDRPSSELSASARLRRGELLGDLRVPTETIDLLRREPDEITAARPDHIPPPPDPADPVADAAPWPHGPSRASAGSSELVLLLDRSVCRFAAHGSGLEAVARCTYFPDGMRHEAQVHGVTLTPEQGIVLLTHDGPRSLATGDTVAPAPRPDAGAGVIVGDQLLWTADGVLYARMVEPTLGPIVTVGRMPSPSVPFEGPDAGCTYAEVLATWLESETATAGRGAEYRIASRIGSSWVISDPVRGRLDCVPNGAHVTHIGHDDSGSTLTHTACTTAGCRTTEVVLPDVTERAVAAPIGDRMLVVWVDDSVRARIAPLRNLPRARPLVLFDGTTNQRHHDWQGQVVVRRLAVHVRGHSAIVELQADDTVGLHLSAAGTVEPVAVTYE
jgi:hypothetical protein